jgi:photosystem II stability/assembly factor-like uncharacterized protein
MRTTLVCLAIALSVGACKKSGSGGGGGGGGGGTGGWLVGVDGLMVNVQTTGESRTYPLDSKETLSALACRYAQEAWVVGDHGTLLFTDDAGETWHPQIVPTTADLHAVATQDAGPVFIAGDGALLTSSDSGAHWTALGDGSRGFVALAAAQEGDTVLALADDGAVFSIEDGQLVDRGSFAGARALAISPDGQTALVVGDRMIARSADGGRHWLPVTGAPDTRFDAVRVDDTGEALAAGSGGVLARIGSDGGLTRQLLGTSDLHTIHLADADYDAGGAGFAAGDGGRVFITTDGGWVWRDGPTLDRTVLAADMIGRGHL